MKTFLGFLLLLGVSTALPCSRLVSSYPGQDVMVGRSMDWFEDMQTDMWLFPRGINRDGLAGANSLKWTSQYASLALSAYNGGTADGMNEKGLAVNALYLAESDFGTRNEKIPGLAMSLWVQYFLDNYATVAEALEGMQKKPFQILPSSSPGPNPRKGTVHLSLGDKTGDSAIIEYIGGKAVVYHSKEYRVMTNSPTFDLQLKALEQYKGFGGDQKLPGTTEAADRFVRAAYYLTKLPEPKNYREQVAGVLSVLRNVSQPFGVADENRPNISPTRWRTVADLTKGIYFYESSMSPNIVWVRMSKLKYEKGAKVLKLDLVNNPDLVGDVTDKFKPATPFEFFKPDSLAFLKPVLVITKE